jgi:UDP-N-acetylmuramoyl-L-alanyl-D-glutamate--2,6-diaminopimelate ligase
VDYFIDFAHTPDGLDKALQYCKNVPHTGRVIVLTGAMGGRDMFKRPDMGAIAHQYADVIVLSDEDPDQEDRLQIIRDIRAGIPRVDGDRLAIIPDRRLAIQYITQIAQP